MTLAGEGRPQRGKILEELSERFANSITKKSKDTNDVIQILDKFVWMWYLPAPQEGSLPDLVTTLPGKLGIASIEPLARQPLLFRLNYVKQLGLVHVSTHIDGCHNRLSHCVGAVQCAHYFLRSVAANGEFVNPMAERAVLIAALVHDCFHGPFGHSLELLRDIFSPPFVGKRLDKYYLSEALNAPDSPFSQALRKLVPDPGELDTIKKYLDFFANAEDRLWGTDDEQNRNDYFLAQIIDSAIDADRIDYVLRDCMHMRQTTLDDQFFIRLIEKIKVKSANDRAADIDEPSPLHRLCFPIELKPQLDEFLAKRRELYLSYYESPDKLVADDMLAHAVYYILSATKLIPDWSGSVEDKLKQTITEKIHGLTDWDLVHFLYVLAGTDPQSIHALLLLTDLFSNHTYKKVGQLSLPYESVPPDAENEIWSLETKFNEKVVDEYKSTYGKRPSPQQTLPPAARFKILRDIVSQASLQIRLLWFDDAFCGGFQRKHALEKLLWQRLLVNPDFSDCFDNYLLEVYGPQNMEERRRALVGVPHVHITLPNYAATCLKDVVDYRTEPAGREKIAFYDENANVTFLAPDLPTRKESSTRIAIVSADDYFTSCKEAEKVKNAIISEFNSLFDSLEWLQLSALVTGT
jgi:HD superfamily phosphohydrolase